MHAYQVNILSSMMLPVSLAILPRIVLSPVLTTTPVQVPSTALEEKKARFLVSKGLALLQSLERGWASDSPVRELLSTYNNNMLIIPNHISYIPRY